MTQFELGQIDLNQDYRKSEIIENGVALGDTSPLYLRRLSGDRIPLQVFLDESAETDVLSVTSDSVETVALGDTRSESKTRYRRITDDGLFADAVVLDSDTLFGSMPGGFGSLGGTMVTTLRSLVHFSPPEMLEMGIEGVDVQNGRHLVRNGWKIRCVPDYRSVVDFNTCIDL